MKPIWGFEITKYIFKIFDSDRRSLGCMTVAVQEIF